MVGHGRCGQSLLVDEMADELGQQQLEWTSHGGRLGNWHHTLGSQIAQQANHLPSSAYSA